MGVICSDSTKQTPCSVHPSAVFQQLLLMHRPSSGHRPGIAVQLRQLADCSKVRRHLELPSMPSTTRCGPFCDGFSNPLQRQQVLLETVSEPQMTGGIRRLTFARRLKWFTVLKDTLLGEIPTAVAVCAANFFFIFSVLNTVEYCIPLGDWL